MALWQTQLKTLDDTDALAQRFALQLEQSGALPMFLALCGSLGAGKTQFMRSLAAHLGALPGDVTSPTYVLMQRYRGRISILHLDFYRLKSVAEVWDLGLDEYLEQPMLVVAEWAELFPECWPENWCRLDIEIHESGERLVSLSGNGNRGLTLCRAVVA